MNRFLFKALLIVGAVTIAVGSFAQGAGVKGVPPSGAQAGGQDRAAQMKKIQEEMFAKLGLTAQQKPKVRALMDKRIKDVQALVADKSDQSSKMAKFQSLQKTYEESLKKILTAEQFKKLEQLRTEMRKKFRGPGGTAGGPGAKAPPVKGAKGGG